MNEKYRLFFATVRKAIVINPFSGERQAVDMELAGTSSAVSREALFARLNQRVESAIAEVVAAHEDGTRRLTDGEFELVRYAFLFLIFHHYCDQYDRLIEQQAVKAGGDCPVPFAGEILDRLTGFGFARQEALRYLALFYQMRRAFYFIQAIGGESRCVRELRKRLWSNIFTDSIERYEIHLWNRMEDFSTMLLGETGTGKGLAAAAIGRSGFIPFDEKRGCFQESFARTFVAINLSQFPEQLIESELFGHRKGAFTGAIEAHKGIFSRCSTFGSIFIDELGDVSVPIQIKLLQILQDRIFSPVGSHAVERFAGRVIGATNRPLAEMRRQGTFRDDFYYRLCSDVIEVPSLRQRLEENPDEIHIILGFIVKRIVGRVSEDLVDEIASYIRDRQPREYPWPGNIRELEQCVRQYLLRGQYQWQQAAVPDQLGRAVDRGEISANDLLVLYCRRLYDRLGTFEGVARVAQLDRRTVKKYVSR